jgi:hypothetical protein
MDLRDPSSIPALNSLLQTENDRKVPRSLIKNAIEACATSAPEKSTAAVSPLPPLPVSHPTSPRPETEREVIEL